MPELPEVETIRRALEPLVVGRPIVEAGGHPSPKFASASALTGTTLRSIGRRGKYLIAPTDDGRELVLHLGMTGRVMVLRPDEELSDYVRAWWRFADGETLALHDVRRFGRVAVVEAGRYDGLPTLALLGPEPFGDGFTPEQLWQALRQSRARVKTQLLSQRPVAGVGNIYADEALWAAQIHPGRRRVSRREADALHTSIREALQIGLDLGGTTLRDYRTVSGDRGANQHRLQCYGRAGQPCPRCATVLVSRVYDGRTTTLCPTCQTHR